MSEIKEFSELANQEIDCVDLKTILDVYRTGYKVGFKEAQESTRRMLEVFVRAL